jgi:hypothetical protein
LAISQTKTSSNERLAIGFWLLAFGSKSNLLSQTMSGEKFNPQFVFQGLKPRHS